MSSNAMVSIDTIVKESIANSVKQYALEAIRKLAERYEFDFDEATGHVGIGEIEIKVRESKEKVEKPKKVKKSEKVKKAKKPEIELPFCGEKMEGFCCAIKKTGGLFNQCTKPTTNTYCNVCQKQADKNSSNKPTIGDISERIDKGDDWVDASGKKPIKYIKYMEKHSISKEKAQSVAEIFGMTIPENEFIIDTTKKGRPKKSVSAEDSDDEKDKKKRGRPSKEKENENKSPGDDLISSLIEEAKQDISKSDEKPKKKSSKKKSSKKKEPEKAIVVEINNDSELEEEDIEIEVVKKTIDGESYLVDNNNVVYDNEQNELGTYDKENNAIIYFDNEEEEV